MDERLEEPRWLSGLVVAIAALMGLAALVGLFWPAGIGQFEVVSTRGDSVILFGDGLYQYDTVFKGAGNRGTDVVSVVVGVPLLLGALWRHRRGAASGPMLLASALVWPLYVYATLAVGTAFNALFLMYVAILSASLFAFFLAQRATDAERIAGPLAALPHRVIGGFMLVTGAVTVAVWVLPLLGPVVTGDPPEMLETNTTMVTEALDLAIITPLALVGGLALLRGRLAIGYRIVTPLLVLLAILAPAIAAQSAFQVDAGVELPPAAIIGPVAGFVLLAALAMYFVARILHAMESEH